MISNTDSASLLMPIGGSIAASLELNPISLMLATAFANSCNFMLSAGAPPNAIVSGSRYVTARQMAGAGSLLNLLSVGIVTFVTLMLFG